MAQLKFNPVIESVRGKIGDLIFKKRDGKSYIARKPDVTNKEPTEAQQGIRTRFGNAALYGKAVLANPQARAVYEQAAKARHKPTFAFAVGDFLNPPKVDAIDTSQYNRQAGSKIFVRATDDFEVTGVEVTVRNGQLVESGVAARSTEELGRWEYITTTSGATGTLTIEATATDKPGHKGTKSATVS